MKYNIKYLQENSVLFSIDEINSNAFWCNLGIDRTGVIVSGNESVVVSDIGNGDYVSMPNFNHDFGESVKMSVNRSIKEIIGFKANTKVITILKILEYISNLEINKFILKIENPKAFITTLESIMDKKECIISLDIFGEFNNKLYKHLNKEDIEPYDFALNLTVNIEDISFLKIEPLIDRLKNVVKKKKNNVAVITDFIKVDIEIFKLILSRKIVDDYEIIGDRLMNAVYRFLASESRKHIKLIEENKSETIYFPNKISNMQILRLDNNSKINLK